MSVKAIDLRRGMAIQYKNGIWVCVNNEKVAKGNWRSSQVIQLKNIQTGQLIQERFRTDEDFEDAYLERKEMEYLYAEGDHLVLMDTTTYDQTEIATEFFGDAVKYLSPNLHVQVAFVQGKPVTIDLPNTVELKIIDTPPNLQGATATGQMKEALCEGGARVKVPAFVENGSVIKVDTRTNEYLNRV
jgi:elongation factor P